MIQKEYIERNNLTLKVEVYYHMGGMNFFNGRSERRGYYLSISPVKLSKNEQGQITSESYMAFTGYKILLLEVKRQSQKSESEALKLAEQKKEQMILSIINSQQ